TGLSAPQPGQFSVADFWDLSLENLRGWLEKQTISPRCDFSDIKQGEIELHVDVEADPAAVFAALISTGQLKRYMGENPTVEPQVGGRYDFGWEGGGPVKIVELVPDKKLAYTWEYPPEPATLVTWTLEGSGGKTQLTIVHSGFTADRSGADYQVGWLHYLARIKFMVETGPGWQKAHIPVGDYELV
ncbi:MAG: SRPBCC domain-containing protein, partial [Anaerolineae bacterium]|nr:SRPBCC domain-containing protein [Anaerolineae bacterium]